MARPRRITRRNTGGTLQSRAAARGAARSAARPSTPSRLPTRTSARPTPSTRRELSVIDAARGRRGAEERARVQVAQRPSVGIRPGQFGEIDEAAGERVVFDDRGRATVQDAQGNVLRDAGQVHSVQEQTRQTRRPAGAPLQSPIAGVRGRPAQQRGDVRSPRTGATLSLIDQQEEEAARRGFTGFASPQAAREEFARRREEVRRDAAAGRQQQLDKLEFERLTAPTETFDVDLGETDAAGPDLQAVEQSSLPMLDQAKAIAASNPDLAPFASLIQDISNRQDEMEVLRDQQLAETFSGQSAVEQAALDTKRILLNEQRRSEEIAEENKDLAIQAAETAKEMARFEQEKLALTKIRQTQELRRRNIDNEVKNRRIAGRMGIEADTNGLQWMANELQRGEDAIRNLEEMFTLESARIGFAAAQQYDSSVRSALNQYDTIQLNLDSQLRRDLNDVDKTVSLDQESRRKERASIWNKYWDNKFKSESETRSILASAANIALKAHADERKFERDLLLKSIDQRNSQQEMAFKMQGELEERQREIRKEQRKNAVEAENYQTSLRKEAASNDAINRANDTFLKYDLANAAMTEARKIADAGLSSDSTFVAVDQSLITIFNKMLDDESVVRESEYARTPQDLGLLRSIQAKGIKAVLGGAGLNMGAREDIFRMIENYKEVYDQKLQEAVQPILIGIDSWNSNPHISTPIDPAAVLPLENIHLPDAIIQQWEDAYPGDMSQNFDHTDTSKIPSVGSRVSTEVVSGTITAYGSKFWKPGLDVAAPAGAKVRVNKPGKVIAVVDKFDSGFPNDIKKGKEQNSGFGNQVKVKMDDGFTMIYSHLRGANVAKGDPVNAGQVVGFIGNTGVTVGPTGNHLDLTILDKKGKELSAKQVAAYIGAGNPLS